MRASLSVSAFVAAAIIAPRVALGAACCGESHGLGERLARAERAAVTTSVRFRERIGAWQATGSYSGRRDGDYDRELRVDAGWLVRATGALQLGVSVPVIIATWRSLGGISSAGAGVGDVAALARYDVLPITSDSWVPGLAFTLGVSIPTGRPASEAESVLASDATGLGVAEFRPGIAIEKDWASGWFALVLASIGVRTERDVDGADVRLAPRAQLAALAGRTWTEGVSVGLGALYESESAPRIDGSDTPGASRRRTAALLFGAYDVTPRWTALASAAFDLPVDDFGRNEAVAFAASIATRFVWGSYD